jgi:hypothetical protein
MLIGDIDGLHPRKDWLGLILSLLRAANNFMLRFDGFGSGELTRWLAL